MRRNQSRRGFLLHRKLVSVVLLAGIIAAIGMWALIPSCRGADSGTTVAKAPSHPCGKDDSSTSSEESTIPCPFASLAAGSESEKGASLSAGFGGGGFGMMGEGGDEIPPLCQYSGIITGIERTPSSFDPAKGQVSNIAVALSAPAANLTVRILNSLEEEVKVLYSGPAEETVPALSWDGTDSQGAQARYSIYLVDAVAMDESEQVIGTGQCDVITYKPKAGISMQDADKYRDAATHEWLKSSDEFVAAGLVNPGDGVSVTFDGQPVALANNEPSGIFRSQPLPYSAGYHSLNINVTPFGTQNSYDINWTVYLNQIESLGIIVLKDGEPVQHSFDYFIPADGEVARLDYSLDAAETDVRFYATHWPTDGSDPTNARTEPLGALPQGNHSYTWDGKDDEGALVRAGQYYLGVLAVPDIDSAVFRPAGIWVNAMIEVR